MAKSYITDNTATNVVTGRCSRAIVQVNKDLTGTIKVIDGTSGTTANVATITNPDAGEKYEYWDFDDGVRVIASGTCDITVSTESGRGH